MIQKKLEVTYQPFNKSTRVPPGTTLFSAAHWIGLPIDSTCGGRGTCGKCKVQLVDGGGEITTADRKQLRAGELESGWRLSCQAKVYQDMTVNVPELLRVPKAATMGVNRLVLLDPNVRKVYLELTEPTLEDQRSDVERLQDALTAEGFDMKADLAALRTLPGALRDAEFRVTAVLGGDQLIALEAGDTRDQSYGVAFDLGTTTVVGTLMNLRTGMAEAVGSTLNGQAPFGADVISRISHGMQGEEARTELREAVLNTINGILADLYERAGVDRDRVYEMVIVGNATMLHLLLGIDATPISMMPFAPTFREPLYLRAREVGLEIHPAGFVQTLPIIGAYVGADIVAGVIATGLAREEKIRVFVDVGTNGEIVLGSTKRVLCTAAPAGPAFEGSQIKCGMRATVGAIEGVQLSDRVELQIIGGDVPAEGICGSGLVDAVAELVHVGLLDHSGRFAADEDAAERFPTLASRLTRIGEERVFVLHFSPDGDPEHSVFLSQRDVRELQFAKASIATGWKVLLHELGVGPDDITQVLLAGSFGAFLTPLSAVRIGLVPELALPRIVSAGNVAGEGAKIAALSLRERAEAYSILKEVEYVEL
ncbi:MAG: DUF4445 domain-containing protein, partial [Chloroflexi bacterium]